MTVESAQQLSVIRFQDVLLATVPAQPRDGTITELQDRILTAIDDHDVDEVAGVILDITSVNIMDSFFARTVAETVQMIELMGSHPVLVGMQPSVAITTTELGFSLGGVDTALDTDAAVELIQTGSRGNNG